MRTETRIIDGRSVQYVIPEGNDSWKGSCISIPELRSIPRHLCNDQDTYSVDGIGVFTFHAGSLDLESNSVLIPFDAPDSIGRWQLQDAYGSGSGGVSGLPDPVGKEGYAVFSDGSNFVLRKFQSTDIQPDFSATFNCNYSLLELGATATTPAFTTTYNDTPLQTRYRDTDFSTWDVLNPATLTSFSSPHNYTKLAPSGVTFTLEVTGPNSVVITRTRTITWRARRYWGVSSGVDSTAILGLSGSDLQAGIANSFTVNAGPGLHILYAFPAGSGTPTFSVGGFVGGFHLAASGLSVTNSFGVTVLYDLYQSDNDSLGSTVVVVS